MKTPQEIVDGANALARKFYKSLGYEVPEGYRFDQAHHPQEVGMWNMAAMAYDHIENTDVDDCLNLIDD